ncbi:ferric-dicitrate binding protein FerR, regulates iron transport through sigma-19 [Pseudarcicella hirudinis]|uniref:Ferric-dicitrate binding protein FerR, regulates iron transport through sigma-19 n=1 Tax=Pseudarcicella hirudinis TaxID=1079859 RepID=A0A1I5P996_9BACT|nr:FecR family protein [Pseudarcicella hirudinis]SFP30688.1 ferric-dicitrate binding protein FerR, regulates iron transport through sigma-19 [Pseudarcicella hirudinis]
MINYIKYKAGSFALDNSFRSWVFKNRREDIVFWENWIQNHPEKLSDILEAKQMVLSLKNAQEEISDNEIDEEISRLIETAEHHQPIYYKPAFSIWSAKFMKVAAVLLLIPSLIWFIYRWQNNRESLYNTSIAQINASQMTEVFNNSAQTKVVTLSDGSSVILQPGSRISYPVTFGPEKREVVLSGEAFFEVAKNPNQPFFVFANELVTKVLGTSFKIKAYENEKNVEVLVKTGKVSVFSKNDPMVKKHQDRKELIGMVLTPNQEVIFERKENRLVKTLIESPVLLSLPAIYRQSFEFKHTPVAEVFSILEKSYGIKIVFDEEIMASCELTASLGDEPLFEKIKLICKVIEANYEVVDAQIIITGKGCH